MRREDVVLRVYESLDLWWWQAEVKGMFTIKQLAECRFTTEKEASEAANKAINWLLSAAEPE